MTEEFDWERDTWEVIQNYFRSNPYFITRHQLDSYNMFLRDRLPKTLRQFNPIPLTYNQKTRGGEQYNEHEIHVYLGASCEDGKNIINDGKGVFIGKPILNENGEKRVLYPNEARLKNITYSAPVFCSIYIQYFKRTYNSGKINVETSLVDGRNCTDRTHMMGKIEVPVVKLTDIPIMLHSNACILRNMPSEVLYQMGECPYDQGGYFLINGKEKVIVAQEFQAENRLIVSKHNSGLFKYSASVRSESEDTFEPARTVKLILRDSFPKYKDPKILSYFNKRVLPDNDFSDTENGKGEIIVSLGSRASTTSFYIKNKEPHFLVLIPNFVREVPLIVLFKALGVLTDRDIMERVVYDTRQASSAEIAKQLVYNIRKYRKIRTREDAFEYIRTCCLKNPFEIEEFTDYAALDAGDARAIEAHKTYLRQLKMKIFYENISIIDTLNRCFLPHAGEDMDKKSYYLGYMTNRLISVSLGLAEPTDRDSYLNKRVHISGHLIATLFRDLYFRYKNYLIETFNRAYHSDSDARYKTDITTLMNTNIMNRVTAKRIIDDGFIRAFKVCWNLVHTPCEDWQKGVVQDLNRLSYVGSTSHLRRVHTPIPKGAKIRAPHALHATTWGMFCPSETPDGGNIGIMKHLSVMSTITFGCHSRTIRNLIREMGVLSFREIGIKYIYFLTKIFVNGDYIGVVKKPKEFVHKLRLMKRNGLINIYTSIAWKIADNEIHIHTDAGRCTRPVYIVNRVGKDDGERVKYNNVLAIQPEHLKRLRNSKNGDYSWLNLIGGDRNKEIMEYDCSTTPADFKKLDATCGVIEYIDVDESDGAFIAMYASDLEHDNVAYTHCEIHPSMILGIQASSIPFAGNNQAPRNQFSGAQGKQAIGIYATNFYNRLDSESRNVLYYPQRPIVGTRLADNLHINRLSYGENAIVAIASYSGYNQEDAVIVSRSALERGLFRTLSFRTYSAEEGSIKGSDAVERFVIPDLNYTTGLKTTNLSNLDSVTGIVRAFDDENNPLHVDEGDILIGRVVTTDKFHDDGTPMVSDDSVYVRRSEYGIVDRIYQNTDNEGYKYCKVRLRKIKIPDVGDKFASRHGQKGTIGMILPGEDMPVTAEGITPDIIVNPHAIPSRMTVGQLVEVIMGKLGCTRGTVGDATAFTRINPDNIANALEEQGYEKWGNETLYNGRVGTQLKCNIFIGPTYYQRLKHMVGDKYNSRGGDGPRTALTHQPTSGRANGGGLRIGEMERDALLSHGAMSFLKESLMERSDGPSPEKRIPPVHICNKTGLMDVVNRGNNGDNTSDFSEVHIPYACKLMLQEFETMGIATRLITETAAKQWAPTERVSDTTDGEREERYAKVKIPTEFVSLFKRKKMRDEIMRTTNIVFYSVMTDKNVEGIVEYYIKIGGNRITLRYATDMIENEIERRVNGTYLTTYKIALPEPVLDKWKAARYSLLNEYKTNYGLKNIDIGYANIPDPRGKTEEEFRTVTISGIKNNVDKFRKEVDNILNDYYEKQKFLLAMTQKKVKPEETLTVVKPNIQMTMEEVSEYSDEDDDGEYDEGAYEYTFKGTGATYSDPNKRNYSSDDSTRKLMEPTRDYKDLIDEDIFQVVANINKYFIVVIPDDDSDEVSYVYINSDIYNGGELGVSLEKPSFLEWLSLPKTRAELERETLPYSTEKVIALYNAADFR